MPRITALLAVTAFAATAALLVACSDFSGPGQPVQPVAATANARAAAAGARTAAAVNARRVEILDACDPASFNAVFGEGFCVREGGRTLTSLVEEVTAKTFSDAWRFAPDRIEARVGQVLLAFNNGGEKHSFTEVKEFGGGQNALLNELSHNPVVAPECQTAELLPPGASTTDELDEEGVERYQCCIHPWMRTTVTVRRS